jgi:NADPH-dependent 2,4-dienoyl-CoA reductase/sulfur reductase-like enzyme
MTIPMRFLAIFVFLCRQSAAQDIVIYGSAPRGIAAAISAARLGRAVTLVEYNDHLGGMTTSGLGKSNTEPRALSIPELQKLLVAQGQVIRHAKR